MRRVNSNINNMTPMQAAAVYCDLGWPVFTLAPESKIPMKGSHGIKDATNDMEVLRPILEQVPRANLAIATGVSSEGVKRLVCIDDDCFHTNMSGLHAWQERTGLVMPPTVCARSARGGYHYIYEDTDELIGQSGTRQDWHVDVRANGASFVVAPSKFWDKENVGGQYEWIYGPDVYDVAPVDDVILRLYEDWNEGRAHGSGGQGGQGHNLDTSQPVRFPDGLLGEGERNVTLYRFACWLRRYGLETEALLEILEYVNENLCDGELYPYELTAAADSAMNFDPNEKCCEILTHSLEVGLRHLAVKLSEKNLKYDALTFICAIAAKHKFGVATDDEEVKEVIKDLYADFGIQI